MAPCRLRAGWLGGLGGLAIALLLAAPALANGQLLVESEPSGAQVYLDGRAIGQTPLLTDDVPDGPHVVVLRRPGYRDGRLGVRILRDLTTRKSLRLRAKGPGGELRVTRWPAHPKPRVPRPHPKPRPVAPLPFDTPRPQIEITAAPPEPVSIPSLAPVRPLVPAPGLPWQHMAFYGLMGMFLALLAGLIWQRREEPADWQADKPLARFHPLTPGRLPLPAVECCQRGMRLVQAGQVRLGAEALLAAYRQAPGVQMIYNLAIAWHLTGSPLAETAYRTAIQLDPAHRDACFNLAKLLDDAGRPLEAIAAYRQLIAAVPGDGAAWFNLGNAYARLGMGAEAVSALQRARKLLGDDAACRHNLRLAKRLRPWWRLLAGRRAKPLLLSSG
ncbi:MAG TPA: PEGA domain-containing protein [Stenomitos sp.]